MFLVALGLSAASAAIGGGTTGAAAAAGLCAVVVGAILYMPVYLLGVPLEETRELDRYRREVKQNRPPSPFYRCKNGRSRTLRNPRIVDASQGQPRLVEGYSTTGTGTPKIRCLGFSVSSSETTLGGVQAQCSSISVRRICGSDHRFVTRKENSVPSSANSVKQQSSPSEVRQQIRRSRSGFLTASGGRLRERFRKSLATRSSKAGEKILINSNASRLSLGAGQRPEKRDMKQVAGTQPVNPKHWNSWFKNTPRRVEKFQWVPPRPKKLAWAAHDAVASNSSRYLPLTRSTVKGDCVGRSSSEGLVFDEPTTVAWPTRLSDGAQASPPQLPKGRQGAICSAIVQRLSKDPNCGCEHLQNRVNPNSDNGVCKMWRVGGSTKKHFNCISTEVHSSCYSTSYKRRHTCTNLHDYSVVALAGDENDKWSVATTSTKSRSEEDWTSSRSNSSETLL